MSNSSPAAAWTRVGLWALPAYGLLVAVGTLTPQPDQAVDPTAWAQFVTAPQYLVQHLATNVVGAVLVVVGTVALGAFLATGRAPRSALTGMVVAVAGQVLLMVPAVISTFVTPAIGAAYVGGKTEVMSLQFPDTVMAMFMLGLVLTVGGNVALGVAVSRSALVMPWAGVLWAAAAVVFYLLGAFLGVATTGASLPTQPLGGVLMVVSGTAIAWSARREHRLAPATRNSAATVIAEGR